MRVLDEIEIDSITGGRRMIDEVFSAGIGWLVGRLADAVVSSISDLNQGGTSNGTTAMGDKY